VTETQELRGETKGVFFRKRAGRLNQLPPLKLVEPARERPLPETGWASTWTSSPWNWLSRAATKEQPVSKPSDSQTADPLRKPHPARVTVMMRAAVAARS